MFHVKCTVDADDTQLQGSERLLVALLDCSVTGESAAAILQRIPYLELKGRLFFTAACYLQTESTVLDGTCDAAADTVAASGARDKNTPASRRDSNFG